MRIFFLLLPLFFNLPFFLGCEQRDENRMRKVHFDRDMCARCAMVISDRKNTLEVIDPKTHKVYLFDDFGCMALWFADEQLLDPKEAIIWVTDMQSGKWIDAKKAFYDKGNITPMAFGYSAHESNETCKNKRCFRFDDVYKDIVEKN